MTSLKLTKRQKDSAVAKQDAHHSELQKAPEVREVEEARQERSSVAKQSLKDDEVAELFDQMHATHG